MAKQEVHDVDWFRKNVKKEIFVLPKNIKWTPIKKGRPSTKENPVVDSIKIFLAEGPIPIIGFSGCLITLAGLAPGLNGSEGLIREHWIAGGKRRDAYVVRIKGLNPPSFKTPVKLTYTRHCSKFSDWDNAAASFKKLGDALQLAGVLMNDSPEFIVEFTLKQVKARQKDQRMEIFIETIK
jgi:hypothetical protein